MTRELNGQWGRLFPGVQACPRVAHWQAEVNHTVSHLQPPSALHADMPAHQETNAPIVHSAHVSWMSTRSYSGTVSSSQRVNTTEYILLLQAQATLDMLFNRGTGSRGKLWQSHQLATEIGDRGSQAFALHLVGWIRGWGEYINEALRLQEQAHELTWQSATLSALRWETRD